MVSVPSTGDPPSGDLDELRGGEIDQLAARLTALRAAHADLLAAARAALSAYSDNEADPLYYLRDELAAGRNRSWSLR